MIYYSYKLPHGGWQTIAAAESNKEAKDNAAFHANGCETNECIVSSDLAEVRKHIFSAMIASIAEKYGVEKFTLAEKAALLGMKTIGSVAQKMRGESLTEPTLDSLSLLLQLPAQAFKKEISRRLKAAEKISQSGSAATKRWRERKEN